MLHAKRPASLGSVSMSLEVELMDAKMWPQCRGERVELPARAQRAVQEDELFHERRSWGGGLAGRQREKTNGAGRGARGTNGAGHERGGARTARGPNGAGPERRRARTAQGPNCAAPDRRGTQTAQGFRRLSCVLWQFALSGGMRRSCWRCLAVRGVWQFAVF